MNIWKIIFQRSQTLSVAFNDNCAGGKRMPDTYDYITLMCRLKAAQTRNKELESGERYVKLKELHQKDCRDYEHKILELQTELAEAHKETIRVRNYWFQVLEDMLLEFEAMQKKAERKLKEMEKRVLFAQKQRDDALDKVKELRLQFYKTAARLEEEQGKKLETSRTNQPGL
ncbi:MAG: hypothetical protein ACLROG_02160 [Coprococcus phoceensis]